MSRAFLMAEQSEKRNIFVTDSQLQVIKLDAAPSLLRGASGGKILTLDPVEAQKLQLGQSFSSVRQITESCMAIHNTTFNPADPKPEWYNGVNGKLITLKKYADQWLNDYAIAVCATIPNSIMDFVPVFNASAGVIKEITDRSPGALSPSDLSLAKDVLSRMIAKVDDIHKNVTAFVKTEGGTTTGKLITWKNDISAAGLDLENGTDTIQKAAEKLALEIADFKGKIKLLEQDIQYYNQLIATGAGLVGGGAFISLVGGSICLGFPIVGGIVLAIGVLSIVSGAVTWGIFQDKANKAYMEMERLKAKIKSEEQTLITLGNLSKSSELCTSNAKSAVNNLLDFAVSWSTFGNSLKGTREALEQGGKEAYGALLDMDMEIAKEHWGDVKQYAKGLLDAPTDIPTVPAKDIA